MMGREQPSLPTHQRSAAARRSGELAIRFYVIKLPRFLARIVGALYGKNSKQ